MRPTFNSCTGRAWDVREENCTRKQHYDLDIRLNDIEGQRSVANQTFEARSGQARRYMKVSLTQLLILPSIRASHSLLQNSKSNLR
jgi:hypothetical protein